MPVCSHAPASIAPRFRGDYERTPLARFYRPRILFVLNPKAGGGNQPERIRANILQTMNRFARVWPDTQEKLEQVEFTTDDATALKKRFADNPARYERVVAVGGDGTLNQVISAARDFQIPVGVIPLGTGNTFANQKGIKYFDQALAIALFGKETYSDILLIRSESGDKFAIAAADTGISADIIEETNRHPGIKKRLREFSYIVSGLPAMLFPKYRNYTIEVDGKTHNIHAMGIAVLNGGKFGELTLDFIKDNDGLLDVLTIVATNQKITLETPSDVIRAFPKLVKRSHDANKTMIQILLRSLLKKPHLWQGETGLLHYQGKTVTIRTKTPEKVDVDGDLAGETPVQVTADQSLRFLTPPDL